MRNQRLVLFALVALLVLGGGAAVYFLFFNTSDPAGNGGPGHVALQPDSNEAPRVRDNTPVDRPDPVRPKPDNPSDPAKTKDPDPAPPVTPKKTDPVRPNPHEPEPLPGLAPGEEVDTTNWPTRTTEHTIKGKVIYKSDGRSAAGAAVTAEINENGMGWGAREGIPKQLKSAAKVEGSTTSDGAGEFTLTVKLTRKVPPGIGDRDEDGERIKRDISPDDDKSGGLGWAGAEWVLVIARMAGYAPARSGAVYLGSGNEVPPVTLSLAIPAALSGRVIDAVSRKGIAAAKVTLYQADAGGEGWSAPRQATTDADGYFSVNDLGAGTYMYAAEAEGYSVENAMSTGRRVDLTKGGEQNLGDIPLLPAATITGQVVDGETGKPVPSASVELEQNTAWGRSSNSGVSTDAEGRFEIKGAAAGTYSLRASASEYAPTVIPNVVAEAGKSCDAGVIKLGRGFKLTGFVVDGSGQGVAGATVELNERGAQSNWGFDTGSHPLGSSTTDSSGAFTITGLSEASARVSVTAQGYAQLRQDIELKAGMAEVKLRLFKGVRVIGRLLAADGSPAKDISAGVIAHSDRAYQTYKSMADQMRWFGQSGLSVSTGEDGRFVIPNVPPDTYLFVAYPPTGKSLAQDDVRVTETNDVDLGDIRLPGPGSVRVVVTENGQPVSGLKIELRSSMGVWAGGNSDHPSAETDSAGVAMVNDVPAGDAYIMTGRDKDTWDTEILQKRRVMVKTGQTVEFKLELKPADSARVHGRVTLNGKPLFNEILVIGTGDKASFFKQTKPDEAGFYEFPAIGKGSYVMHCRTGDKTMSSLALVNVDLAGELEITRDFAGYGVSGIVSTPNNTAAERASVKVAMTRLNDPTPEVFTQWMKAETPCDADGRFRFENVGPGSYRLTASLVGVGSVTQDVIVSAGDASGVALALANNSGSLRVTLKKLNGTPLSVQNYGFVQLRDAAGTILTFEDQNAGFFMPATGTQVELTTVPAGTYTMVINTAGFLPQEKAGVTITTGTRTDQEIELTAAAELHMTVTNAEITQAQLDAAVVRYFDAQGVEVTKPSSPFDAWSAPPATEAPTLRARYIGPGVAQVKVKLVGFVELTIAVEFEAGKKIEKQETLVAG